MKISLKWLNQYLSSPINAQEAERLLTDQGFPIESVEAVGQDDTMLDVEITSNRGDCLSHLGIAREIAAGSGRQVVAPDGAQPAEASNAQASSLVEVSLQAPEACSLYTARVIQGVKVAPSPPWLVERLQAIGLRSVNNVVDVTNFVLMELGQPLHAFDRAKLQGGKLLIRHAKADEPFDAIDGTKHKLSPSMLVIADAVSPVAVAGVMGGIHSEVGSSTRDIVLEAATFSAMSVRQTSRALKLMSDSSYRFERGIDPQVVERASRRAAKLILELAGGTLASGVCVAGQQNQEAITVELRIDRCNALLGWNLSADRMRAIFASLNMAPRLGQAVAGQGQTIICTIPSYRLDITREVDLIEEVARVEGLNGLAVQDRIQIEVRPPQSPIVARRKLDQVLVAHGYFETMNFSFLTPSQARPFVADGHEAIQIDDDRRKSEPILRPSLLPSLLHCRKANQDAGNSQVKLFELASSWSRVVVKPTAQTLEKRYLSLLADAASPSEALRDLRGTLDELLGTLTGQSTWQIQENVACDAVSAGAEPVYRVSAHLLYQGQAIGHFGLASRAMLNLFGLQTGVVLAELEIEKLLAVYPPVHASVGLSRFPGTVRDLSVIVDEAITWSRVEAQIHHAQLAMLESIVFLTTYRGKPIPAGRKSISFRMAFRDSSATLRHEQVEPQMQQLIERFKRELGAEVRM